jgi:hypothetical protein
VVRSCHMQVRGWIEEDGDEVRRVTATRGKALMTNETKRVTHPRDHSLLSRRSREDLLDFDTLDVFLDLTFLECSLEPERQSPGLAHVPLFRL